MTKLMKTIHDVETGEVIVREMTEAEIAQYELDVAAEKARKDHEAKQQAEKKAVLDKLGLTADEVTALLS